MFAYIKEESHLPFLPASIGVFRCHHPHGSPSHVFHCKSIYMPSGETSVCAGCVVCDPFSLSLIEMPEELDYSDMLHPL